MATCCSACRLDADRRDNVLILFFPEGISGYPEQHAVGVKLVGAGSDPQPNVGRDEDGCPRAGAVREVGLRTSTRVHGWAWNDRSGDRVLPGDSDTRICF